MSFSCSVDGRRLPWLLRDRLLRCWGGCDTRLRGVPVLSVALIGVRSRRSDGRDRATRPSYGSTAAGAPHRRPGTAPTRLLLKCTGDTTGSPTLAPCCMVARRSGPDSPKCSTPRAQDGHRACLSAARPEWG